MYNYYVPFIHFIKYYTKNNDVEHKFLEEKVDNIIFNIE